MKSPLKWHGGKYYLRRWLRQRTWKHLHLAESYFGGGEFLFAHDGHGVSECANDINGALTNFWRCLQTEDRLHELKRYLESIPFSSVEWLASKRIYPNVPGTLDVPAAGNFFVLNRQSRQGLMKDFATLSRERTRRGMNEQVSAWLSAIDGLPEAHARLKRVVIECMHAPDFIRKNDGPTTFHYCDPPYLPETRVAKDAYEFEMTEDEHIELLDTLSRVEGKFMLSGYYSPLYDAYAREFGWRVDSKALANAASGKAVKDKKIEMIWTNYDIPTQGPDVPDEEVEVEI